jgi:hypothetical protein
MFKGSRNPLLLLIGPSWGKKPNNQKKEGPRTWHQEKESCEARK